MISLTFYNMFLPLLVFVWKLSPQEFLSKRVGIKSHQWYHLCAMLCLILPIHTLHKALGTFLQRPLSQHASQVRDSPSDRPVKRGRLYSQRDCQIFITIWGYDPIWLSKVLLMKKGKHSGIAAKPTLQNPLFVLPFIKV